jgi:hypothetical protein
MNVEDRFQVTLDVAVIQVNNERVRLQFKTDNGTIVRFWYGVESLPIHAPASEARSTCTNGDLLSAIPTA